MFQGKGKGTESYVDFWPSYSHNARNKFFFLGGFISFSAGSSSSNDSKESLEGSYEDSTGSLVVYEKSSSCWVPRRSYKKWVSLVLRVDDTN